MSIFDHYNVETMNEDDVAGEIVRPFCRALGYKQGHPKANLRSQVPLQYDRAYLGHKDGQKDPVLRGRPDFVCEVVSYARWVIEAKAPWVTLSLNDSQQAHTYATHPEIAAAYYILTNGREFRLYRVGNPQNPIMSWLTEETDSKLITLQNFLGPEAMKAKATIPIDLGKPLGIGLPSSVKIVGGNIVYAKTVATVPMKNIDGLRNPVFGNHVNRSKSGLIVAEVHMQSAFAGFDEMQKMLGFNPLLFKTAQEYISSDRATPTLFQNLLRVEMREGLPFPPSLLGQGGILLADIDAVCYTEALGFLDGKSFRGTFVVDYDYKVDTKGRPIPLPPSFQMRSEGTFDLTFT